jgi:hypothetical protein
MSSELVVRVLCLCVALAGTETLHGIARTIYLAPKVGTRLATKLSIVSGSLLAFAVCYLLVPSMRVTKPTSLLTMGLTAACFMAVFDIAMGRLLLQRSWTKALSDLNPSTGNYLFFGLSLLVFYPLLVMYIKQM